MNTFIHTPPGKFLSTNDLDELHTAVANVMEPRRFSFVGPHRNAHIKVNRLALPGTQIFRVKSATSIHVRAENLNSIQLAIPLKGSILVSSSGSEKYVMPGEALFHVAGEMLDITWQGEMHSVFVRVEPQVLTPLLDGIDEGNTLQPRPGPHILPLTHGLGRTMTNVLNQICSEERQTPTQTLQDSALDKVLPYILSLIITQDILADTQDQHPALTGPRHLQRAVDFLMGNLENDLSLDELVAVSFVSARTLQRAFFSRFGMGPMKFIRRAKLTKAREELLKSSPHEKTVHVIACKWGFYHASNFAKYYFELFNETPTQTLRQGKVMNPYKFAPARLKSPEDD